MMQIPLTFEDTTGKSTNIVLQSPMIDTLLALSERHLLFSSPRSTKIAEAVSFLLESLSCPVTVEGDTGEDWEEHPEYNVYFRKLPISDKPPAKFQPNLDLFPETDEDYFMLELIGLEHGPAVNPPPTPPTDQPIDMFVDQPMEQSINHPADDSMGVSSDDVFEETLDHFADQSSNWLADTESSRSSYDSFID